MNELNIISAYIEGSPVGDSEGDKVGLSTEVGPRVGDCVGISDPCIGV